MSTEAKQSRRFLTWVQFDGTSFCGYQRQPDRRTVAGDFEQAWKRWRGEVIHAQSSSRTDSGVHARRMPISFKTTQRVPSQAVMHGMNHELAFDMAIQSCEQVGHDFHVRHDAIGKRYVYRLWNGRVRSPLRRINHWQVSRTLDIDLMAEAAPALIGSHAFDAFRSVHCQSRTTRRAMRHVSAERDGDLVTITIEGNAFLHNMVRVMVGTLVEIGWGKIAPSDLPAIIASRQRVRAGQTAPAVGLTLDDVFFGPHGAKEGLNFKKLDHQVA
jgi:tRNA pseudouridine38-40 synthase